MREIFRWWLRVFGVVVIGIALTHLFVGQSTYIGGGQVNSTMESDLRFYNILFALYGLAFIWVAEDLSGRVRALNLLNLIFFLGGLSRILAWAQTGRPSWFYVLMIPVELVIPVVNHLILRRLTTAGTRERVATGAARRG